jgi:hypothetical protein
VTHRSPLPGEKNALHLRKGRKRKGERKPEKGLALPGVRCPRIRGAFSAKRAAELRSHARSLHLAENANFFPSQRSSQRFVRPTRVESGNSRVLRRKKLSLSLSLSLLLSSPFFLRQAYITQRELTHAVGRALVQPVKMKFAKLPTFGLLA